MRREEHFEAMYRDHGGAVRTFVHRRVPHEAADDLVADVFVAAWRRLDDAPEDELAWLYGIARGVLANRRRGEARRRALLARLASTAVPRSEPRPSTRLERSPLTQAMATLREADREILRLVAWERLDRALRIAAAPVRCAGRG